VAPRGKTSPGKVGEDDRRFMKRALTLARKGLGSTSPNPAVGAVIVKSRRVVAEGWHRRAGMPHAEVEALRAAEAAGVEGLGDATMYVTLEPCRHHGRTPPCTGAVINSRVGRVVVGTADPNPRVSGEGIEELRAAGVDVTAGVLAG